MNQNIGWFAQSIIAATLLVPAWLAIGFFHKNFRVQPEVFLIWYFVGVCIASIIMNTHATNSIKSIFPSLILVCIILFIGFSIGGVANVQLFKAIGNAPNPGIPVAIANTASIGVFIFSALLAMLLPRYFNAPQMDFWTFVGVILTIIGVSIIALRR
jgi:hypothetical protein